MSRRQLHLLLALYPEGWRRRHGPELEQLVSDLVDDGGRSRLGLVVDLVRGGVAQRFSLTPSVAFLLVVVAAGGVVGGMAVARVPPVGSTAPHARLYVHRNAHGRVTEVLGAPVKVTMDPKSHKVLSIERRRGR